MKRIKEAACAALLSSISAAAISAPPVVQPIQVGQETVRYDHGVPTLDLEHEFGAVQITPLPVDHGSFSFGIAVLNRSDHPANIDISDVSVHTAAEQLPVLSKDQLESKAKNRAMWAQIALAAAGGLSAAAAANQRDHYHSTLVTPHGTYHAYVSAPSAAGQVQATAIAAGTGVGIAAIQKRLDETRQALGDNIVQLTTVDPDESYAGQIILTKLKAKDLPQRIDVTINFNGDKFPFAFQVAKPGTPAPAFTALTPPPPVAPAPSAGAADGSAPVAAPAVAQPPSDAPPAVPVA